MSGGQIILGLGAGVALVGIAWQLSKRLGAVGLVFDEAFGDFPAIPGEFEAPGDDAGGWVADCSAGRFDQVIARHDKPVDNS